MGDVYPMYIDGSYDNATFFHDEIMKLVNQLTPIQDFLNRFYDAYKTYRGNTIDSSLPEVLNGISREGTIEIKDLHYTAQKLYNLYKDIGNDAELTDGKENLNRCFQGDVGKKVDFILDQDANNKQNLTNITTNITKALNEVPGLIRDAVQKKHDNLCANQQTCNHTAKIINHIDNIDKDRYRGFTPDQVKNACQIGYAIDIRLIKLSNQKFIESFNIGDGIAYHDMDSELQRAFDNVFSLDQNCKLSQNIYLRFHPGANHPDIISAHEYKTNALIDGRNWISSTKKYDGVHLSDLKNGIRQWCDNFARYYEGVVDECRAENQTCADAISHVFDHLVDYVVAHKNQIPSIPPTNPISIAPIPSNPIQTHPTNSDNTPQPIDNQISDLNSLAHNISHAISTIFGNLAGTLSNMAQTVTKTTGNANKTATDTAKPISDNNSDSNNHVCHSHDDDKNRKFPAAPYKEGQHITITSPDERTVQSFTVKDGELVPDGPSVTTTSTPAAIDPQTIVDNDTPTAHSTPLPATTSKPITTQKSTPPQQKRCEIKTPTDADIPTDTEITLL